MEGYCPLNQKMSMISDMCKKWHSDESVINDEKGRWWVKGKKKKKKKQQQKIMKERKNPFWTAACKWPTNSGRHTVLCCFWCPNNFFKKAKKIFPSNCRIAIYDYYVTLAWQVYSLQAVLLV